MKRSIVFIAAALLLALTGQAWSYHIEVLQVSDITAFNDAYESFIEELERNGLVEGKNLTINREVIDADAEAGLWEKMGILMKIKKASKRMAEARPDLAVTISTPATKYAKERLIEAGIPLVFGCVAIPEQVGCVSKTVSGPGFTGTTIYMDPKDVLSIAKLALPGIRRIGIVHSDDDNALAFIDETRKKAGLLGISIITREINKSEKIDKALDELMKEGIDAFGVPIDTYYGLRDWEASKSISRRSSLSGIPIISFINANLKGAARGSGAVLYIGSDFNEVGRLTGTQAISIIRDNKKPGELPILRQADLNIQVDVKAAERLGIEFPIEILKLASQI